MSRALDKVAVYAKFLIATLTPVVLAVQAAVTDDHFTQTELVSVLVAAGVALGVLAKGNRQPAAVQGLARPGSVQWSAEHPPPTV